MKPILVVDDDPQMRAALKEAIQRLGYQAVLAEDGQDALLKLGSSPFAMVITDMKMPRMDGLDLLKNIRRKAGALPVLIITGHGTVENAVEAMKEGAAEYLMKPFSFDTLSMTIDSMMERLKKDRDIVSTSPAMSRLMQYAADVAQSDTTVLITGESGTGKELLARYIHRAGNRKDKPFIAVNCAAIPETLMESELFGYEKGAFTGAQDRKKGKFELADGGTLLLDEIGEMPLNLQSKLLRVLQEKEIDRVGAKEPVPVDIRIIATTNRDLYKEAMEGKFREDLFYRLNVFPLHVPPLRERPEDIETLTDFFVKKFSRELSKDIKGMTVDAISALKSRFWRGNVRELENSIQRAVLLSRGESLDMDNFIFPDAPKLTQNTIQADGSLKDMEKDLILRTLKETNGNKTLAAKKLGVSVRTIRNKLDEYEEKFS